MNADSFGRINMSPEHRLDTGMFVNSMDLHPFLTINELNNLLSKSNRIQKKGKDILQIPFDIFGIRDGKVSVFDFNYQDLISDVVEMEIHELPKGSLNNLNENSLIRVINKDGAPHLFVIQDRTLFFGEIYNRVFPIIASKRSRKIAEETQVAKNDNLEDYYRLVMSDPTIERLGKFKVVIVGAGTVGKAVADSLSKNGVGNMVLFETPNEVVSVGNVSRYVGGGVTSIDSLKWENLIENVVDNNPIANVTYLNAFPGLNTFGYRENIKFLKQWMEGEDPVFVVLGLDDDMARIKAHEIFDELGIPVFSPTDLGRGALLQFDNYSNQDYPTLENRLGFNPLNTESRIRFLISLLGGPISVVREFDKNLVEASLSNAYPFLPQSASSAYLVQSLIANAFIDIASGKQVQERLFVDPTLMTKNLIQIIQENFDKLNLLIATMRKAKAFKTAVNEA